MSIVSFLKEAKVKEFIKPTMTYDKRPMIIMSVEVDGQIKRLNLVGEPNTAVQQLIEWLAKKKLIVRDNDGYTLYVPTNALAKERDGTIWVHIRDYKAIVGD